MKSILFATITFLTLAAQPALARERCGPWVLTTLHYSSLSGVHQRIDKPCFKSLEACQRTRDEFSESFSVMLADPEAEANSAIPFQTFAWTHGAKSWCWLSTSGQKVNR